MQITAPGTRRALPALIVLGLLAMLAAAALGPAAPARAADVEDYAFSEWTADYNLYLDDDGRAGAQVTETITADRCATDP